MSWDNKTVWSEGMFIRPQHFQQQDRYVEKLVRARAAHLRPHAWGVAELELNRELLATGRFAVAACRGVMEDGTPFAIPGDVDHPPPLEVPENTRNAVVYLALPVHQPGGAEVADGQGGETAARYAAVEFEAVDTNAGSADAALLRVGRLRFRYLLESEDRAGFVCLGLARIAEIRADKNIVLDERYIPPSLACAASGVLTGFVTELQGLIHHRGQALAGRVTAEGGAKGVAEIADFLLLQAVNRYEPLLGHFAATADLHPETFYAKALEIAGELATFTAQGRRPAAFPAYRHDDLERSFAPLMRDLRQSLSAVLEQTAVPIPLQERKYGIRVAPIMDRSLLKGASFVLAVKAQMPAEQLRRHFPNQVKIGPVEQIRELVNVALPGIPVRALPVAPRQMPYYAGTSYFELDRTGHYWQQLATSGGIAIHLAGDFPRVEMELWAIKE